MTQALHAAGAGVVASFCLEGGVLSGKYLSGAAAGRAAATLDDPRLAPAVAVSGELAGLAAELGTTAAALALAFPVHQPATSPACCSGRPARSSYGPTARRPACWTG